MPEAILYDSHMHTPLCKHAIGQPEAYAATAQKNNIKGIIFTCHNPGPPGWDERIRMRLEQFDEYVDMVQRTRDAQHRRSAKLQNYLRLEWVRSAVFSKSNAHCHRDVPLRSG
jgi:hypothetical protein